ncbi:hypothetical protein DMH08_28475 [Actinomadura sp. WAC 06369]|nr:hypothetical protein DMH08_28475 [Actinomadura sp. WAC 06369]
MQISGAKRWRVYGPTRPAPMYRDIEFDDTPPENPIDEFTLYAGDVLHVPRGWWHAASASTGQPSLHLTCGLSTHTGIDLLTWLVDRLRDEHALRADLPRPDDHDGRAAWSRKVTKLITERLRSPSVVETYFTARDAAYGTRGGFSLPYAVREQLPADHRLPVRMTAPRAVVHHAEQAVVLEAAEQRWTLAAQTAPLVDLLCTGQPTTLGSLAEAADITVEQAAGLIGRLTRSGIVAVGER